MVFSIVPHEAEGLAVAGAVMENDNSFLDPILENALPEYVDKIDRRTENVCRKVHPNVILISPFYITSLTLFYGKLPCKAHDITEQSIKKRKLKGDGSVRKPMTRNPCRKNYATN